MVRYTSDQVENAEISELPPEGRYLAEVGAKVETKFSKKEPHHPYFSVSFKDASSGVHLCFDNIMMGGAGLGIGHKKLLMLGVVKEGQKDFDVEPEDLIGKRCVLTIKHDAYTDGSGQKKVNAKPDFNSPGFGYAPESNWIRPSPAAGEMTPDDTPF